MREGSREGGRKERLCQTDTQPTNKQPGLGHEEGGGTGRLRERDWVLWGLWHSKLRCDGDGR